MKVKIFEEKGLPVESLKLVHKGNQAIDGTTLETMGVKEGDFMVVMVLKKAANLPPPPPPPQQQNPIPQPNPQPSIQQPSPIQPQVNANPQPTSNTNDAGDFVSGEAYNRMVEEIGNM